jgi:iron uptake system EfeUOB component EfeO/EfeM
MMPNKTIYVKDSDLPLFEQAQGLLGESISSMFAEFLKERVGKVTPQERMTELISQISRKRTALKKERGLPKFIDGIYAEAEAHAKNAVNSLRAGRVRQAKALYYAANVYHERAERDLKEAREVAEKLTELLGA